MFLVRDFIDEGNNIDDMSYPTMPVNYDYIDYDDWSDVDERDHNVSDISNSDYEPG